MPPNPSTIWASLAVPNPAAGGIPFIFTDNATPVIDVLNFYWGQTARQLSVATSGDTTGTDTINTYLGVDSYLPMALQTVALSTVGLSALGVGTSVAGYSVSASAGTGIAPTTLTVSQLIGHYSGWAYMATPAAYVPMAGEFHYTSSVGTAGNLGGETHWATRADAGVLTDRMTLDNSGVLQPSSVAIVANVSMTASARLGKANKGFGALSLAYTQANATGNITQNVPVGQVQITTGQAAIVVTNSLVTANSLVLAVLQTADATLTFIKSVVCAAGQFTITGNTNATGTVKVGYLVIGTDS